MAQRRQYTGLFLLLAVLVTCAGVSLGLTYAPCYASLCSEEFFPYATRVHIANFYALLASIGCVLLLRAYSPWWRAVSTTYLTQREVPMLGKRISVGGLTLSFWIVAITVASTGFWLDSEDSFWSLRTNALGWADAQVRLTVTGILGHHCDIVLGLVLLPVSRNSVLGRAFELHQSTLLFAHKLLAYTLMVIVIAHGAATYVSLSVPQMDQKRAVPFMELMKRIQTFVATYAAAKNNSPRKDAFNVDNPTLTAKQTEERGAWHSATLGTGMMSFLFMLVIIITALPVLRRTDYNTFYYVHVILSTLIFVAASIHASTDFYFLLPGLLLWVLDWCLRLFRGGTGGLRKSVTGILEEAGGGWYRVTLPVAAKASNPGAATDRIEANDIEDGSISHPIQTYYLNIPCISKLQNHAFTAAKIGSATTGPVFLFQHTQPRPGQTKQKKLDKEWTWKLENLASDAPTVGADGDDQAVVPTEVEVRVEGPYIPTEATGFHTATRIICVVGGTGLTGAYSLALWWLETRSQDTNARFSLIWTIRYPDAAQLRDWRDLEERARRVRNMRLRVHVSSVDGRMDVARSLRDEVTTIESTTTAEGEEPCEIGGKAWIYVSGPAGLLSKAEDACVDLERELRLAKKSRLKEESGLAIEAMEHYVARWEV